MVSLISDLAWRRAAIWKLRRVEDARGVWRRGQGQQEVVVGGGGGVVGGGGGAGLERHGQRGAGAAKGDVEGHEVSGDGAELLMQGRWTFGVLSVV